MSIFDIFWGLFALSLLAPVVAGVVKIYNQIKLNQAAATRAWSNVLITESQKSKVLNSMESTLTNAQAFETQVLTDLTELRMGLGKLSDSIPNQAAHQMLSSIEQQSSNLASKLHVTAEAYPALQTSAIFQSLMLEISQLNTMVTERITDYNKAVEDLNGHLSTFPCNLLNGLFFRVPKMPRFSLGSEHFDSYNPYSSKR